ncbi:MAG: imidazoleglycerol-phosphate dehydratase HisB [Candidatus Jordarchaeum sp.]|uniref:imidazoleglycerol-phosphate dehydratase HisB n=1 Tax=Candidatus Jordarchaeum sp. TaxID=2823881 RepID=UPI00404B6B7A
MRTANVKRETLETKVEIEMNLDGTGRGKVQTGVKFLDHQLRTLSKHSLIDLDIKAEGDLSHHIIEDVAITLGETLTKALGKKKGIFRFGWAITPMDDALAVVSIDLGGRSYVTLNLNLKDSVIEDMESEDIEHFLLSFTHAANLNLHAKILYGDNNHHKAEALFKALALSLRQAVSIDPRRGEREVPSVKGTL